MSANASTIETLCLGSSPLEESAVQVSKTEPYMQRMQDELNAFAGQLGRESPPVGNAKLEVQWSNHEFGKYGEVFAVFDAAVDAERDWAYGLEKATPCCWDEPAKQELRKNAPQWWAMINGLPFALGNCLDFDDASERAPDNAAWIFSKEALQAFVSVAQRDLEAVQSAG